MKKQSQKTKSKKTPRKRRRNASPTKREAVDSITVSSQERQYREKSTPALQKKAAGAKKGEAGTISRLANRVGQFLRDAKTELKKVKWPTRKELLASTAVVIVLTIVISFFLGLVDFGLIKIIKNLLG